jgi:hypothetical protein
VSVDDSFTLSPEIRAAIVWDVPRLQQGSSAAANLVRAFGPVPWNLEDRASGPLELAARGVLAANVGRVQDALETWGGLVSAPAPDEQLLGHLLRLWVSLPRADRRVDLQRALDIGSRLSGRDDRARVCRKVASAALDSGEVEIARSAVQIVLDAAEPGGGLDREARWTLWNLGDRDAGLLSGGGGVDDDLLTQPWIYEQALGAATDADLDRFRDELAGVWSRALHFGQTPMDVLNSAQRQADWAAKPVLRDSIVRLMCVHILERMAESEANVRWAAMSWVIAKGKNVTAVLNRTEPRLDAEFAHELIETIAANPLRRQELPSVVAGLWRLVADDAVGQLLALLGPGELDDPTHPEARQVWANLLWRDPSAWYLSWLKLGSSERLAAITEVPPEAVDQLEPAAQSVLLAECATVEERNRWRFSSIAAALATLTGEDPAEWFDVATPQSVLELVRWRRSAVPDAVLERAIRTSEEMVNRARDEAREGTFGAGAGDSRAMLGAACAALGRPDPDAERLLLEVAGDARMSSDQQLGALQGLASMREAGVLSRSTRDALRALPDATGPQVWGKIDTGAIRVARLYVLADDLTGEEKAEVLSGCRSRELQVRLISVAALESILTAIPLDPAASWTLLSALYDPSDDVLTRALEVLARGSDQLQVEARLAAGPAVVAAYRAGRHQVRRAAVGAAAVLQNESPEAALLVATAVNDPSWEIRRLAMQSLPGGD